MNTRNTCCHGEIEKYIFLITLLQYARPDHLLYNMRHTKCLGIKRIKTDL